MGNPNPEEDDADMIARQCYWISQSQKIQVTIGNYGILR